MQYIENISIYTHEVKRSKFIAHLIPYEIYESTLKSLKQEHPKARHFVSAFRYLNEYDQILEGSSDDGEPKGTSGKPSLMVLQGHELINSAVIIVRYFGGTKLGTGGLVRAYGDAVNLALDETPLKEYKKEICKTISVRYGDIRFIDYECETLGVSIVDKIFETDVVYKIKASEDSMNVFLEKVQRVAN